MNSFLNQEVRIFPCDTYAKRGIVREITDHGIIFQITYSETKAYTIGKLHFIAFDNLTFEAL